jgi:hypothetical protein
VTTSFVLCIADNLSAVHTHLSRLPVGIFAAEDARSAYKRLPFNIMLP